jgi:hypothetical protein
MRSQARLSPRLHVRDDCWRALHVPYSPAAEGGFEARSDATGMRRSPHRSPTLRTIRTPCSAATTHVAPPGSCPRTSHTLRKHCMQSEQHPTGLRDLSCVLRALGQRLSHTRRTRTYAASTQRYRFPMRWRGTGTQRALEGTSSKLRHLFLKGECAEMHDGHATAHSPPCHTDYSACLLYSLANEVGCRERRQAERGLDTSKHRWYDRTLERTLRDSCHPARLHFSKPLRVVGHSVFVTSRPICARVRSLRVVLRAHTAGHPEHTDMRQLAVGASSLSVSLRLFHAGQCERSTPDGTCLAYVRRIRFGCSTRWSNEEAYSVQVCSA